MVFGKTAEIGDVVERQFFHIMGIDIVEYRVEFLHVLFLLIDFDVGEKLRIGQIILAVDHKKVEQVAAYGQLPKLVKTEIFVSHQHKKRIHFVIDLRISAARNMDAAVEERMDAGKTLQIADHGNIE